MKKITFIALAIVTFFLHAGVSNSLFGERCTNPSKPIDQWEHTSFDAKYEKKRHHHLSGYTKLMCAIEMGLPVDVIEQLIQEGEDVNAREVEMNRVCNPVLRYALERGTDEESLEIIRLLLENGADPLRRTYNRVPDENTYGIMTLFHYAVIYSSPEIVQTFIDFGVDVNHTLPGHSGMINSRTPLESAKLLKRGDIEQILERAGAI